MCEKRERERERRREGRERDERRERRERREKREERRERGRERERERGRGREGERRGERGSVSPEGREGTGKGGLWVWCPQGVGSVAHRACAEGQRERLREREDGASERERKRE